MSAMKMKDAPAVAWVKSWQGDAVYEIRVLSRGVYACTCPAYRFTKGKAGAKKPCKHLMAFFGKEPPRPVGEFATRHP